jgi:hypothetical protein
MIIEESNTVWEEIVNTAASRLEADFPGLIVSQEARQALLDRVNEHRDAADSELSEGRATPESISEAAYQQLLGAVGPAQRLFVERYEYEPGIAPHTIQPEDVLASMSRRCHWIPWC